MTECRRCHFVACICRRGERDPFPKFEPKEPSMHNDRAAEHFERDDEAFAEFEAVILQERATEPVALVTQPNSKTVKKTGPGSRYVEVPAATVRAVMKKAGFVEDVFGGEVVFKRTHAICKHTDVKVYTSLPARGGNVRAVGEDAIRIVAVYEKQSPGRDRPFTRVLYKNRAFRTAPSDMTPEERAQHVMERVLERAREAYGEINKVCKSEQRCFECCGYPGRASREGEVRTRGRERT